MSWNSVFAAFGKNVSLILFNQPWADGWLGSHKAWSIETHLSAHGKNLFKNLLTCQGAGFQRDPSGDNKLHGGEGLHSHLADGMTRLHCSWGLTELEAMVISALPLGVLVFTWFWIKTVSKGYGFHRNDGSSTHKLHLLSSLSFHRNYSCLALYFFLLVFVIHLQSERAGQGKTVLEA